MMSKIVFYMPKHIPENGVFGSATLGFAGMAGCREDAACEFGPQLQGVVLNGSYEEILANIEDAEYKAAIVLCGNAGGENQFVEQLSQKVKCPVTGGGAAMDGNVGGLIAGGGQASVLLVNDENYDVQIEVKNIHSHIVGTVQVDFDEANPRIVKAIDGQEPKQWLDKQKKELGISENDFEHFTLSDVYDVNAHLSWDGQNVMSGRDLEHEMIARYVKPAEVYDSVFEFYDDDENTIVFGCAGVKGITGEITKVNSLGLYMYGEICMADKGGVFGNLMLSKILFVKK